MLIHKLDCPAVKKQQGKISFPGYQVPTSQSGGSAFDMTINQKGDSRDYRWARHEMHLDERNFRSKISILNVFSRSSSPIKAITNGKRLKWEEEA